MSHVITTHKNKHIRTRARAFTHSSINTKPLHECPIRTLIKNSLTSEYQYANECDYNNQITTYPHFINKEL